MSTRSRSFRGSVAVVAAVAVVVAAATACSGGDDDDASPTTPSETQGCEAPFAHAAIGPDGTATADTGVVRIDLEAGRTLSLSDAHGIVVTEPRGGGLQISRDGPPIGLRSLRAQRATPCAVTLAAEFADGTVATVALRPRSRHAVEVTLALADWHGVTGWGERLSSPPDELVYGLTERTVDDWVASEAVPEEVGSLDRRGEIVSMWVQPTMSVYAPFFQTSSGYGVLVEGTMPGAYDIAASRSDTITFTFEHAGSSPARFVVLHGREHMRILDEYTRIVGRPPAVPDAVFTHWLGHDELATGDVATLDGVTVPAALAADLRAYDRYGIPPGIYHFDRPWAEGSEGYGALRFDRSRFPDPSSMLDLLADRGWRAQVWISEWVLDARGREARRRGYLAAGSDRVPDLTDPAVHAWFVDDLRAFLRSRDGVGVDGFFLDRTDEVVPSDATDVYADGRTGREIHNAYPVLVQQAAAEALAAERGSDGWLIARAAYTGSSGLAMQWGGDTRSREGVPIPEQPDTGPSTDLGLRSVLVSLQRAAFLGLPYWGSDIGGYTEFADREVYARWIEVGAVSPLMRFHGKGHRMPWDMPTAPRVDEEMIGIYRRYVQLHHLLAPYLVGLAAEARATGAPIARPLVFHWPDDPGSRDRWDEWTLGRDLLAAPVWRSGARGRTVHLPPGEWVDFWDRTRHFDGPVDLDERAPLDHLPLYVRDGSPLLDLAPPA